MKASGSQGLFSELDVEVFQEVAVLGGQSRLAPLPGVLDVVLQEGDVDGGPCGLRLFQSLDSVDLTALSLVDLQKLLVGGVVLDVGVDHEGAQVVVELLVDVVLHHAEDVESRENGVA